MSAYYNIARNDIVIYKYIFFSLETKSIIIGAEAEAIIDPNETYLVIKTTIIAISKHNKPAFQLNISIALGM